MVNGKSIISHFSGIESISNNQEDSASLDFGDEMDSPSIELVGFSQRMSIHEKLEEHQDIYKKDFKPYFTYFKKVN